MYVGTIGDQGWLEATKTSRRVVGRNVLMSGSLVVAREYKSMNGSLTYGPLGRLISALAIISAFIGSLQASGMLNLLPAKYSWVGLLVTGAGLLIAGFSERIQGGASSQSVRIAAQQSDNKNEIEATNKQ